MSAAAEPILPDAIYTSSDVARLVFRCSVQWWYANRKRLVATEGFPRPISKNGQPKWLGSDLIAWCRRDRIAPTTVMLGPGNNVLQLRFAKLRQRQRNRA